MIRLINKLLSWWNAWWVWGVSPWQFERDIRALERLADTLTELKRGEKS